MCHRSTDLYYFCVVVNQSTPGFLHVFELISLLRRCHHDQEHQSILLSLVQVTRLNQIVVVV